MKKEAFIDLESSSVWLLYKQLFLNDCLATYDKTTLPRNVLAQ